MAHLQLPDRAEAARVKEWKCWPIENKTPDIKIGEYVKKLGSEFRWSELHKFPMELEPFRRRMDPLADAIVPEVLRCSDTLARTYELEKEGNAAAHAFLESMRQVPDWVDWEAIERAQVFYLERGLIIALILFYLSLAGGFSAPKINRVLRGTGYLNRDRNVTYARLVETSQMIHDASQGGRETLYEGGAGWESCARVRLLHATVRKRLMDAGRFDTEAWGMPINQEDLVGTQLSFSCTFVL
jgi:ER-bound oxygenase mpaB/B'/Rubber oxygenase, catalytic domain